MAINRTRAPILTAWVVAPSSRHVAFCTYRDSALLLSPWCCSHGHWETTASLWVMDQTPGVRSAFPASLPLFSLMIFQMNMVSVLPSFRLCMLGFNDFKANGKNMHYATRLCRGDLNHYLSSSSGQTGGLNGRGFEAKDLYSIFFVLSIHAFCNRSRLESSASGLSFLLHGIY